MSTTKKTCNKCGVEKPIDEFHTNRRARDGKLARCKTCENAWKRHIINQKSEWRKTTYKLCTQCGEERPLTRFKHRRCARCILCQEAQKAVKETRKKSGEAAQDAIIPTRLPHQDLIDYLKGLPNTPLGDERFLESIANTHQIPNALDDYLEEEKTRRENCEQLLEIYLESLTATTY